MAVKSVLEGITEYFLQCPLLKDGVFRVDALGTDPVEYTIETGICGWQFRASVSVPIRFQRVLWNGQDSEH